MRRDRRILAGSMAFAGSVLFLLGMIVAEAARPGYSASINYISDLGVGPVAYIFNSAVILFGLATISVAFLIRSGFDSRAFPFLLCLSGLGTLGVGLFPENQFYLHVPCALTSFIAGGLSAIISSRFLSAPFSYFSAFLGTASLAALLLFASGSYIGLGPGGMERMIVYPLIIWSMGLGGALMEPFHSKIPQ